MAVPDGAVWLRVPRFIGDALMMGKAVRSLGDQVRPLVAWGPAAVVDLFEGSSWFDGALVDPPEGRGLLNLSRQLQAHRPRALLNFPRSLRALGAARIAGIPVRLGWSEAGGRFLATHHLPFEAPGHQQDRYLALSRLAFPLGGEGPPPPFRPRGEAFAEAAALREAHRIQGPYIVLGLGAAAWIKRLGTPILRALVPELRRAGFQLVMLGGSFRDDMAQAVEMKSAFPDLSDLCGRTSLPVSAALVAECAAILANDSALSHLAAACGSPAVTVFGPTRSERTAALGPKAVILKKDGLDCLGCLKFSCQRGDHACMQALDPAIILSALLGLAGNPVPGSVHASMTPNTQAQGLGPITRCE